MTGKRTKIHHFVPKAIQRYFCAEPERIWFSERQPESGFSKPEMRNIDSTFKKRNYYTVLDDDKPSDKVERDFYGTIDNHLGALLEEIGSIFENGEVPVFQGEQLRSFQRLIFPLMKRSPDYMKAYDDIQIGQDVAVKTIAKQAESSEPPHFVEHLKRKYSDLKFLRRIGRDVRVRAQVMQSEMVEMELERFEVRWAQSDGTHSFLLSSLLAFRLGGNGSNGISNPDIEIWMPISPKRAIVLLRDKERRIPLVCKVNRDHMRKINEFAVRESSQIASHSQLLLRSLLLAP